MQYKPAWFYRQSGVIPYRVTKSGYEILLITSRRKRRWIIPKGIVEPGLTAAESAQKEAEEEAGIAGRASIAPVGEYRYAKWGGECIVQVFALHVHTVWDTWLEADARTRQWMTLHDAAHAVREPALQHMILTLPGFVRAPLL